MSQIDNFENPDNIAYELPSIDINALQYWPFQTAFKDKKE